MTRLTDFTTFADAQKHYSKEGLWALFDGTRERFNIAHECIDRHVDGGAVALRIAHSDGADEVVAFEEISRDEWTKMMDVNVAGTWLACKAVVPEMRKNGYGKIINISSGVVFKGVPLRVHYVASKAAIIGFTRTLARELGADNITVNCIAPGGTLSEENPTREMLEARQKKTGDRAIKRVQVPEDLAGAIAFFASTDSDFITGQTLVVDGGSAMH